MEAAIAGLVQRFEQGTMSRRERTLVSLRRAQPAGTVDHFAISIQGFNENAAKRPLEQRGYAPCRDEESGFHVNDPDGANVQLV